MIFRDELIQQIDNKLSDGEGGFISNGELSQKKIQCKASLSTNPEVMNAYGQHGEQVLQVISRDELSKEAFYLYSGNKYTVRVQTNNGRLYYSTLVEVK